MALTIDSRIKTKELSILTCSISSEIKLESHTLVWIRRTVKQTKHVDIKLDMIIRLNG